MPQNETICKKCKGDCCKRAPGIASPTQFDIPNREKLHKALSSGKWSIDWWEGDPRKNKDELTKAYFIRPATKENGKGLFDPSWGGECVFLTKTGCTLAYKDRPIVCQKLKPQEDHDCKTPKKYTKNRMAISWLPYNKLIVEISDKVLKEIE